MNAKRYLVARNPDYLADLSDASLQTLTFQGGPMSPEEATDFEQNPHFHGILQMRRWDELGEGYRCTNPVTYALSADLRTLSHSGMKRFLWAMALCGVTPAIAQKTYQTLQVPGRTQFCQIDTNGRSAVLPSGRLVTPAGNRYTHHQRPLWSGHRPRRPHRPDPA